MLTQMRVDLAEALEAEGITAVEYTTPALRPPVAAVVPGQPYVERRPADEKSAFAKPYVVRLDVLLLTGVSGSGKAEAETTDSRIETALSVIGNAGWRVVRVTQPGVVTIRRDDRSSAFVGAVIQIEQDTKEPEAA